jgi:hypothetical protein
MPKAIVYSSQSNFFDPDQVICSLNARPPLPAALGLGGHFYFSEDSQHLAGLGVDKMNSRASGTRHGFVNLAICGVIGSNPALHLQTSSWAAVDEDNSHLPAIWEQRRSMALLISANVLFAGANFTRVMRRGG